MHSAVYHISEPETLRSCVVFASPHSGAEYPDSFLEQATLDRCAIRSSEDAFVDQLYAAAPESGAPLLSAKVPRCYVDLNRGVDELDPALIEGVRRRVQNPRVGSGLGVIPRVVANGRTIYRGKLPRSEAEQRLKTYWYPYHAALSGLLDRATDCFGQAILIDCHSMPHEALDGIALRNERRPEIVLGDRFGASAGAEIVGRVEAILTEAGLCVVRNTPFAGAYITQTYGRPSRHQHALQIEIDRSLYMDETRIRPSENFEAFKAVMGRVVSEIAQIGMQSRSLAAE